MSGPSPQAGPGTQDHADPPFGAQVRAYLADCAALPGLDRRYHPTADGAVKVIWHRGPDEAEQIREAFRTINEGCI